MNAQEARAMTRNKVDLQLVLPLRDFVNRRIQEACARGSTEIVNPLYGMRSLYPATAVVDALWLHLQNDGFKVVHHPDPDPGHPASAPYTTVSW